jgi:cytochrome c556
MRLLLTLLAGLLAGALLATNLANTMRLRHAYPRGVMAVMQHHLGALRAQVRSGKCTSDASRPHFEMIAHVARDIDTAFADLARTDPDFVRKAADFARAGEVDDARPIDCAGLDARVSRLNDACESCHRAHR